MHLVNIITDQGGEMMGKIHAEFCKLLAEFMENNPDGARTLSNNIDVSIPTVRRWVSGKNFPHPSMCQPVIDFLRKKIKESRDVK